MTDIKCWRDKDRICDYRCPAHSHYGGWKFGEKVRHLKLRRGHCVIIEALKKKGDKLPDVLKQELVKE